MNKYVVGYLNFFDNELKQKIYLGSSEYLVALDYLVQEENIKWDDDDITPPDYESLQDTLFNMDIVLSVIKI